MIEANLAPPRLPAGLVVREALVRALMGPRPERIAALIAPPGYGKTTVLAQWRALETRPVAWLTLSRLEADPIRLLAGVATAVDRAVGLDPSVLADLSDPTVSALSTGIPRLTSALHRQDPRLVLMIDDVHAIAASPGVDALGMLLDYLPSGIDVGIAGRHEAGLPLARLRASGQLLDLTALDLALDEDEARAVVGLDGPGLDTELARDLHRRTEGWPAVLYLAARAHRRDLGSVPPAWGDAPGDRDIASYLDGELLGHVPPEARDLMIHTSIADTLTGGLCDAITAKADSARLLEQLAADNVLVVALDASGSWYRYHTLLREHLLRLLEREPVDVAALHRRAADWLIEQGMIEPAIEHLLFADPDEAAVQISAVALPIYRGGRIATLLGWIARLDDARLRRHPYLAAAAGWIELLAGRADEAERMASLADSVEYEGERTEAESSFEAIRASVRAIMARRGLRAAVDDAERGVVLEPRWGPWRPTCLVALGGVLTLDGEEERADAVLREAMAAAANVGAARSHAFAAALRALLAIEADDWPSAAARSAEASASIERHRLDPDSTTACVAAVAARVAIQRNDLPAARAHLASFVAAKTTLTDAMPWLSVRFLLQAAQAHLALADPAGARTVLWQAEDILRHRPDLGDLQEQVTAMRARIRRMPPGPAGASTLTPAEIRVLRLLPTYLSIPEIAERLNVAPSTVRTQVQAIFGKLGASSRTEAVESAVDAGLLEPLPVLASVTFPTS